jgi:hypothetical protein
MPQPVSTAIERLDALTSQLAQGVVHTFAVRCHGYFPVVAFREARGQPDHPRPPPTEPPLLPVTGEMPVEHLHKAPLDHLPDEQGHIVDPLRDADAIALPQEVLGLLRQVHSHGPLLPHVEAMWARAEQLHTVGSKDRRAKSQPSGNSAFGRFVQRMGSSIEGYDIPPKVSDVWIILKSP